MAAQSATHGIHGILAPAARLDRWLQVVLVVLVATGAVRYVDRHGLGVTGVLVLLGAAVLALAYATRTLLPGRSWWPTAWVAGMVAIWTALTLVAPSFAWCAVPVAFAVLRVLPFGWAAATTVLMTLVVAGAWWRVVEAPDPTLVAGPVGIALVTVIAYRTLERESRARQRLLDDLTEAQAELAEEQRRSGALAERTRLSRDIHDSVGQGLSSINLLLQAAEQSWTREPATARDHVRTAAATARDGLDEVRRVVRDLAPAELTGDSSGTALPAALRRAAAQAAPGLDVEVRVHGTPVPLRPEVAAALVSTARGALANVREHAGAARVAVTLTYHDDEVLLDIRDDGRGFQPGQPPSGPLRGRGLRGIRERAEQLGGRADVESAMGEGTTVSVRFPLEVAR
ncbi:Signal transduction histidine kinase [Actinokineospora alba]|uniref:Signal transduction histidine kinase n=1 Tax=Actinokineospora alba TaxID=504798 RepID=A0A1H0QX91_9PSEU|nr:sensor histidine kinase [Actinokineospora alba]TDP70372.1 signal transduction histidine kinase [Actinokineospora alba]SDI33088.1 Signal transduction histidine kinase [Actinokineospora alba]SDP21366.1 Signal transduction histidine kinase [Actinokineospora alba]